VCPQTETPSAVDSLKTFILQRETSLSQKILENTNSIDDIVNSEPWKIASRNGCFQPQSSKYWEFFSPGSRWNLCQRRDPLMMQIIETKWSRISNETLTDLVPKIEPSRLQEMLINPAISQLQVIYKEFFTSKQVQIQGIQLSQRLTRELHIKSMSQTFTRNLHELQKIKNIKEELEQSIKKQTKIVQKQKSALEPKIIETTGQEIIHIQKAEETLENLKDELAVVIKKMKIQKKHIDAQKGEIQKLKATSNSHSVDAEMVQNFFYLFFITSVMLGRILEYVREYSVRNPPTGYIDINLLICYIDSQAVLSGYIIPVDVKVHFSDIFIKDLSSVSAGNERIISNYKSDEKSPHLTVRVEFKSDKTTLYTKIEEIKNDRSLKIATFDYNGIQYRCIKKRDQSHAVMTGPFVENLCDPVKNLQKANSEHDTAS